MLRLFLFLAVPCCVQRTLAMRLARPWTDKHWNESIVDPEWPFAYSKYHGQAAERKGRTNSDVQDMRHPCDTRGVESKCHVDEAIACGAGLASECRYQLQGVTTPGMSKNVPTASDSPWAVGGAHRYDFGSAATTHVCVVTSGGHCVTPNADDYSNCSVRCWGHGTLFDGSDDVATAHLEANFYARADDNADTHRTWDGDNEIATDVWEYPKTVPGGVAAYNPQGWTGTLAGGSSEPGYLDATGAAARFNLPQDVAVDADKNVYVADAGNHVIRKITPAGVVTTVAGAAGQPGHADGAATAAARLSSPSGVAVYYDWRQGDALVLLIADTGNHRIRRLDVAAGTVSCFSGRCGSGTSSETATESQATPQPGYADGPGHGARFDSPRGIDVDGVGNVFVADTQNHLIRVVNQTGYARTLAGHVELAEVGPNGLPAPGCMAPCLAGQPGSRDGNLSWAEFSFPADVSVGPNSTVVVVDQHRLRRVSVPVLAHEANGTFGWWGPSYPNMWDAVTRDYYATTSVQGVETSGGRVVTLAGGAREGERDGMSEEAEFNRPDGVVVGADLHMYVVDAVSCRVRRASAAEAVAVPVACTAPLDLLVRPSGCSSYDAPVDARDLKVSPKAAHVYYNYLQKGAVDPDDGNEPYGRSVKNCVGSPPPDRLDKRYWNVSLVDGASDGANLVVDDGRVDVDEDTGYGTTLKLRCPPGCLAGALALDAPGLRGGGPYADTSSVCYAALHAGVIDDDGGMVVVTLQRGTDARQPAVRGGGAGAHGVAAGPLGGQAPGGMGAERLFSVAAYARHIVEVQTVSGHPAASLTSPSGYADAQPAIEAKYALPSGVSMFVNATLSESEYLYIADTDNHAVRFVTATCSMVCENGGACVGAETCACAAGWTGPDCATPDCSGAGAAPSARHLCVGPDTYACVPGYEGASCEDPLCVQPCHHGGVCAAPDTCACAVGWFDANCSTPVCAQTCGNGGACVAADTCECPTDWTGHDCRIPVCAQTCENGGFCTAPDTCTCPPQWTGADCALPVCTQGFFVPDPATGYLGAQSGQNGQAQNFYSQYQPCQLDAWCEATNGFDCRQRDKKSVPMEIPSGPDYRHATGRTERPDRCDLMELGEDVIVPFQLLGADTATTPYQRYTDKLPYDWTANPPHPWSAYAGNTDGKTQPWGYVKDRQVAWVEWANVTRGVYACANGGNCTAPDVCQCAPGWIGFDCRTPVCTQGYYSGDQDRFVTGLSDLDGNHDADELANFEDFLDPRMFGHRLQWEYSNPNYTMVWEGYLNKTDYTQYVRAHGNVTYKADRGDDQGGYYCSVRSWTEWEKDGVAFDHPNYYSRYMDTKVEAEGNTYTHWTGMAWPPLYAKTPLLELLDDTGHYLYTNRGHRKDGIWETTGHEWTKGTCVMEFNRTCPGDRSKERDLHSALLGVLVQDTDVAYRARMTYDENAAAGPFGSGGRWFQEGGECVDHVVRGCRNNGTCVAPDTCACAAGWTGHDCSVPVCASLCQHNGNCTLPDTCTCERGWEGPLCETPMCAQECNNGGVCVAPDVCRCDQYPTEFYDGHEPPRPRFRKPNGDPQLTGWTGYDCSVPICVQAERFIQYTDPNAPNTEIYVTELGGHGFDGTLSCDSVRCPTYDKMVTSSSGESFMTGCGWDPLQTGCCRPFGNGYNCRECGAKVSKENNFTCVGADMLGGIDGAYGVPEEYYELEDMPDGFYEPDEQTIRLCGRTAHQYTYSVERTLRPAWPGSTAGEDATSTSSLFMCGIHEWEQGDYIDDAGLVGDAATGTGVEYGENGALPGFQRGRHIRVNYANLTRIYEDILNADGAVVGTKATEDFQYGTLVTGEGFFECYNRGSCLGPDVCSCKDGYGGIDCNIPLCRHLQPTGRVTACENLGVCAGKDDCECVRRPSLLWEEHEQTNRGMTGWTGTDCSMPICVQGFFDPFCTDLPQAPGGEGCYRCANSGNCTAPDQCQCAEGWTGFDCRTPVCEVIANPLIRKQLKTVDEEKVHSFESDPCQMLGLYDPEFYDGAYYARGNCTLPNQCTCFCKWQFNPHTCHLSGGSGRSGISNPCNGPWQDPLVDLRNVLGPNFMFGTRDCRDGYEGSVDRMDRYTSCHLTIFKPTWMERYSIEVGSILCAVIFIGVSSYSYVKRSLKKRYMRIKIERRKSRRSSEESITAKKSAFSQ